MAHTTNSSIPSVESSSYVLLLLSIGVLKRSVPEMVVFNNLIPEQEKEMIKTGVGVIEGTIKPEAYIKKLETLVKKSVNKSICFDDYTIQQLLGRLNLSKSPNQNLDKETAKKVKSDGTLKEDSSKENQPIRQNDPRFDKLPDDSKMLIWKALHSWGALRDFADPVTKPKLDFALNRFKKNMSKFSPATSLEINKVLAAIDPSNWKQYKPEPVVQDFQLNSVESEVKNTFDCWTTDYHGMKSKYGNEDNLSLEDAVDWLIYFDAVSNKYSKEEIINILTKLPEGTEFSFTPYGSIAGIACKKNIVKKVIGEEIIEEAIDREQIKNLIKQKGSATMLDLLTAIGGKPTQPPNNQQVSLFMTVKKMLAKGEVTRVKDGKVFRYSIGNGTAPVAATPKVKASKLKSLEEVLPIINSSWSYKPWKLEDEYNTPIDAKDVYLASESGDRGPRIDHGGGEDGDGWMDDEQVRDVSAPYYKKWKPRLEQLKQELKKKGIDVETYVDYGEKGYVFLQLKVKNLAPKQKKENLEEGEYDAIRFFPNSGVHPLVQQSVKKAFDDLQKKYPNLSNMDCRKEEGAEDGWPRLYFTYRGKNLSCKLNLTGDTYTKVMQDIKRRIDPPQKTNARFISPGYRW